MGGKHKMLYFISYGIYLHLAAYFSAIVLFEEILLMSEVRARMLNVIVPNLFSSPVAPPKKDVAYRQHEPQSKM